MKTLPLGVAGISFRVKVPLGWGAVCRAEKSFAEFIAVGEIIITQWMISRRGDRIGPRRDEVFKSVRCFVASRQLRLATTPGGTEKRGGKQRDA